METTVEYDEDRATARVRVAGRLNLDTAAAAYERLQQVCDEPGVEHVELDLSALDELDSAGVGTISVAMRMCDGAGKTLAVGAIRPEHRETLDMFSNAIEEGPQRRPAHPHLAAAGERVLGTRDGLIFFSDLLVEAARVILVSAASTLRRGSRRRQRMPRGHIVQQATSIGVDSLLILAPLGIVLGFILAFQAVHELRQFGADVFVADLVGIGMVREMGGLLTAIIVAGRSGSAIAAELGTMAVREELDALRAMGVSPMRYLVAPRLVAMTMVMPALTLIVIIIGLLGGYMGAALVIDVPAAAYYRQTVDALMAVDFVVALIKSFLFGLIIALTACHVGMRCKGGARSVGHVTTRSVVVSLFLIIFVDSVVAAFTTVTGIGYHR